MTMDLHERNRLADQLYKQYGKPLEEHHAGEYVAISPQGQRVLGGNLRQVLAQAREALGPGSFVFKVGERAVWKVR